MVVFLEKQLPTPTAGYYAGYSYSDGADTAIDPNTNGLIIQAALYAIQN